MDPWSGGPGVINNHCEMFVQEYIYIDYFKNYYYNNCKFLPQGTTTSHGGARGFLCGWVGPGNRPSSSCRIVPMLLEKQRQVKTLLLYNLILFPLPINIKAEESFKRIMTKQNLNYLIFSFNQA